MKNRKSWPIEYAYQLVVGNSASNIAVCCFWSSKDRFKNLLEPYEYAIIGNLYSRAGINSMLRNILANPVIRYLVITGKSLTDSDEALLDFFERGVDEDWRIIGNGGQIDRDLPLEVLEEVRRNVKLIDLRVVKNFAADFHRVVPKLKGLPSFAKPRVFPKTHPSIQTFPNEFLGFVIRQQTIFQVWCEILWTVMNFGYTSPTDYGLKQKEVLALLSVIENPTSQFDEEPHWAPFKKKDIEAYVRGFFEAEKSAEVAYHYGHRLQTQWRENQIEFIASELKRAGHSRRALANLWDPVEDSRSADPPCITTIQAVVRDERLHLMVYIRSNDMFRAYPLNAAALAELQARVARQLDGVRIGPLSIFSFSAHIYSDCWDACQPALAEAEKFRTKFKQDPRGSFVFRLEDGLLAADHYSPEGDFLQTFRAENARDMSNLIAPFVGHIDHSIYLGKEINRLASALASGEHYEQDKVK